MYAFSIIHHLIGAETFTVYCIVRHFSEKQLAVDSELIACSPSSFPLGTEWPGDDNGAGFIRAEAAAGSRQCRPGAGRGRRWAGGPAGAAAKRLHPAETAAPGARSEPTAGTAGTGGPYTSGYLKGIHQLSSLAYLLSPPELHTPIVLATQSDTPTVNLVSFIGVVGTK